MISLLTPFALWLAPLAAVPLMIHLLGRARPKPRDFPSLLAVQGGLEHAMKRHRLKNWLQLILRTLVILCLLLAAADPVWRARDGFAPPAAAGLLLHNGAYGAVPAENKNGTLLAAQQGLLQGLDSLANGNAFAAPLFPEAGGSSAVPRLGGDAAALGRLLLRAGEASAQGAHIFIPVFDPRTLVLDGSAERLREWLGSGHDGPHRRAVFIDFTDAAARLTPFAEASTDFSRDGIVLLRIPVAGDAAPVWTPRAGAPRETTLRDGKAEIALPLPADGWITGSFSLPGRPGARYGWPEFPVSLRVPPPATLCHLGAPGSFASLATLGAGGPRLRVMPLSDAGDIERHDCTLLYLDDPPGLDSRTLALAAGLARSGGRVIFGTGRRTDPALWNRHLLGPLGLGRMEPVRQHEPLAARANVDALEALGWRAETWGDPGTVRARMGFTASPEAAVLVAAGAPASEHPLLVHRSFGSGALLLWLTALDDPDWSDFALGPWPALLHQAFAADAWSAGVAPFGTASGTSLFLPAADDTPLRVLSPEGIPVESMIPEPGGVRVGPFESAGNHAVVQGRDTAWLAVHPPLVAAPDAVDGWRMLHEALGSEVAARTVRVDADDWRRPYGGERLRLWLLLAAALLLFAEGVVSLRLSSHRNPGLLI